MEELCTKSFRRGTIGLVVFFGFGSSSRMITLVNVSMHYAGGVSALKNVNLHIKPKEFVSVVGRSGTGKSTLVKMIFSELKPSEGRVVIGDWDITNIRAWEVPLLRRQVGVVFQDFKLIPSKTVFENVAFALEVSGVTQRVIRQVIPQVLRIVNLSGKESRFPRELSGGEQQRVSVARALVHRPKILLADEPTGNLDSINTREIIDLLQKINELGTTVVLVTHNREVVNTLRRRVVVLEDGMVISDQQSGRYTL